MNYELYAFYLDYIKGYLAINAASYETKKIRIYRTIIIFGRN